MLLLLYTLFLFFLVLHIPFYYIFIDPNDHNVVYAGTGDLRYGSYSFGSAGVLKSSDQGETWTYTASYTVTQDDLDAGSVVNTATATGTFNGTDYTWTDTETVTADQDPSITMTKSADPTTYSTVGETITYSDRKSVV